MTDHNLVKLGALPPHPAERSNRVMLTSVLADGLPDPSPSRDWTCGVTRRPMFGNDTVGDCTIAAVINIISSAMKLVYGAEYSPTTEEALAVYYQLTGGEDTGLVIEDVIAWLLKNGFNGHHAIASAAIDTGDIVNIKRGIDWGGTLDLGVNLPNIWKNASRWTKPAVMTGDSAPGTWGGHSIASDRYDESFLYVWTWGELIQVEWDAVPAYFLSVDVVITAAFIKNGQAPSGLNLTVLEQRMSAMKAAA